MQCGFLDSPVAPSLRFTAISVTPRPALESRGRHPRRLSGHGGGEAPMAPTPIVVLFPRTRNRTPPGRFSSGFWESGFREPEPQPPREVPENWFWGTRTGTQEVEFWVLGNEPEPKPTPPLVKRTTVLFTMPPSNSRRMWMQPWFWGTRNWI